ncbi:MAG: hypothetical protein GY804_02045 [Alphaproteobacteria bacterium]|nr:hypothetical protein [Alphaproteobacteria bacterium]
MKRSISVVNQTLVESIISDIVSTLLIIGVLYVNDQYLGSRLAVDLFFYFLLFCYFIKSSKYFGDVRWYTTKDDASFNEIVEIIEQKSEHR